ncbi:MAG TPA: hypothetical protein VMT35_06365, partial [Ignavibacteriaceae bacterium]|nr:hypothetical protein [Ignavibacteriaceae bacterium]
MKNREPKKNAPGLSDTGKGAGPVKKNNLFKKNILNANKKRIFWGITLSIPFLLIILLEIILRIFNYGGNLDLFVQGPPGFEKYYMANSNVARRYFYVQSTVPNPPIELFYKVKPKNGYRIFVLGESSARGFPYGNNASFPNILQRGLSRAFPGKEIEVINISMAAINSYTLLDLLNGVLEQSPDALLIYTGHNEYYGALGVGSVQSLGSSRWLIRTYLKLQSLKVFLLLRDFIGMLKNITSDVLKEGREADPTATMMERIVAEQTIPYGSTLYEKGKEQFEENIEAIIQTAREHGVKIIIGELVSNIKDQAPFISVKDKDGISAKGCYEEAKKFEAKGDLIHAKSLYFKAKDLDALRFRAPEDFNIILKKLAVKYSIPLVPTKSYFEKNSPEGLIGNSLMLEHLHPNYKGYFLIAEAFYETMKQNKFISANWSNTGILEEQNKGVTALDSVYATVLIRHLKGSWPFQPKGLPNRFVDNFKPANQLEALSFKALVTKSYNLVSAHYDLGKYYEKKGELDSALSEYYALIAYIPHEPEFYQLASTILILKKDFRSADSLLLKSIKYRESPFANKWIGQIAYMNQNYADAVKYLIRAD